MTARTQHLALSGLFIAIGILLPMLFHAAGLGKMFLPMFFPVAACAFFLPFPFALSVSIATPVLSFVMTGMPPVPDLLIMILELPVMAGCLSLLSAKTRLGSFWKTAAGLLAGRATGFLAARLMAPFFGLPKTFLSFAYLVRGFPGMILLIILLPLFLLRIKNEPVFFRKDRDVQAAS
ncbi:ECF transporter S component [bacterium]|nr:ECF transporter S component [bacterium]